MLQQQTYEPSAFTVVPTEVGTQTTLFAQSLFWIPDPLFQGDMFFEDDDRGTFKGSFQLYAISF
jgi:hypothetical protein